MSFELTDTTAATKMLTHYDILHLMYPSMTFDNYKSYLEDMIPHNYGQVAVYDDGICSASPGIGLVPNYGAENISKPIILLCIRSTALKAWAGKL